MLAQATKSETVERQARKVTRHIKQDVKCLLWGRAAARCEFSGCNQPLWKSKVTQDIVNVAQKAHIYAFSEDGPRGHEAILADQLNNFGNLMLVCDPCHKLIDRDESKFTAALLREMKRSHELRIDLACSISPTKASQILTYTANIGQHNSTLDRQSLAAVIFPTRYPASEHPIELGSKNSAMRDSRGAYWLAEAEQLRSAFEQRIKPGLDRGERRHFSVFALAPQPLLILLGTLLTEITDCDVYQRHKEPDPSWLWPDPEGPVLRFNREPGTDPGGTPCLVLGLSATITEDRIREAVPRPSIWTLRLDEPNPGFVKSRRQQQLFRDSIRAILDQIKAAHGQTTTIHIFPAAPQSLMVEFGRVRMPKADAPWRIYDQVNDCGGFVHAVDIGQE